MEDARLSAVRGLVEPLVLEQGLELVELACRPQAGGLVVRLLVDAPGGVTLHQCAQLNQAVGEALEAGDVIEARYTVEVSSPGLDRPLAGRRDFERALGEDVLVAWASEEGRIAECAGMVLAVQPEAFVLKTAEGNVTIPLASVRRAKKVIRFR
jgi:ribosome maturation factor RimP